MSGIVALLGPGQDREEVARALLQQMRNRGVDRVAVHAAESAVLGVCQHDWELPLDAAGDRLVARSGPISVVADATLYYREDLLRDLDLMRMAPGSHRAPELILAAYRAWGEDCVDHLEGDYAFALYDDRARYLLCARDFYGKRGLYWARLGDQLVVASQLGAVRAHPGCPHRYNLVALAEDAAALTGSPTETCYTAVQRLPPGWKLTARFAEIPQAAPFWEAPRFRDRGGTPFEEAAEELRTLLEAAVAQRLDSERSTSIWLSGGWDSPAVFAFGSETVRSRGNRMPLLPVSVSYPPGDPGREDELIDAIVAHWNATTRYIPTTAIPLLDGIEARAGRRDEPMPHLFEAVNHRLARESRDLGARVVLDGGGGDQLFQVSTVYLADLLIRGHWWELAREWQSRGGGGFRRFFKRAIQPLLSPTALKLAALLRGGKPLADTSLGYHPPYWIRPDFIRRERLLEREQQHLPARRGISQAGRESLWYLTNPFFGKMSSYVATFALEEGLDHRSPLADERVLRFAADRPVRERRSGRESKRLLRRATHGLLPDHVLKPRPKKTGVSINYLVRDLQTNLGGLLDHYLGTSLLADYGIIAPDQVRAAWQRFGREGDGQIAVGLYVTLEVELWLRAREGNQSQPTQKPEQYRRTARA